jgi:hypothetical protein
VNDSFSVTHPHAIRIALATRKAVEAGILPAANRETAAEFEANLIRLADQLTYSFRTGDRVTVDVVLVDEAALYRVEVNGLRSRATRIDGAEHQPAAVRIVCTLPVVSSVGRLETRVAQAVEIGLLEIELSDAAGRVDASDETTSADKPVATVRD